VWRRIAEADQDDIVVRLSYTDAGFAIEDKFVKLCRSELRRATITETPARQLGYAVNGLLTHHGGLG
jgi:hypothetical protein